MKRSTALIRLTVALLLLAAVFQGQVRTAQASVCTDGQIKSVVTGPICSCGGTMTPRDRYLCIGGAWEYQYSFCGGPECQGGGGGGGSCQEQPGSCSWQELSQQGYLVCPAQCTCCY